MNQHTKENIQLIISWVIVILAAVTLLLLTINSALGLSDTIQTKVCTGLNLTYNECGEYWNSVLAQNNLTTTIYQNITNNITTIQHEYTNITYTYTYNNTYALDTSQYVLKDIFDAKLEKAQATNMQDLYNYIKEHPITETIYVNTTFNPDNYVTNSAYATHLATENANPTPSTTDNNKLYLGIGIIVLLAGYYFYKQNKKPVPIMQTAYAPTQPSTPAGPWEQKTNNIGDGIRKI